jgi:hypothetical protein
MYSKYGFTASATESLMLAAKPEKVAWSPWQRGDSVTHPGQHLRLPTRRETANESGGELDRLPEVAGFGRARLHAGLE